MDKLDVICTAPIVSVAIGISVVSHMPSPPQPDIEFQYLDKILHFAAYAVFGICLQLAIFVRRTELARRPLAGLVIGISALFAAYDEIHQYFVPNRDMSIGDWLADCCGAAASLIFSAVVYRIVTYLRKNFFHRRDPSESG